MSEALYRHYERELMFIRQMAQQFARQYPAAAGRLLLEPNRSVDPHVERLIEAFAYLTARVQQKLDDDFPELTDALFSVLYPHYLAPIPSMAVVQFDMEPANAQPGGLLIPSQSRLHTQKVDGVACLFRTCYPVTLWPVEITKMQLQPPPFPQSLRAPEGSAAVLRMQLDCLGDLTFSTMSLDRLRFHFFGDSALVARLYELIFNHAIQVQFRSTEKENTSPPVVLRPQECLHQVGFDRDEGLLPYPNQSFLGYRLLTEFFAFPPKFLFLDLGGWPQVAEANFGRRVEVDIYLDRTAKSLEQEVDNQTFRLGCAPVVNLFEQTAEPIPLDHTHYEYRVTPDVHHPRGLEVYSIDSLSSAEPRSVKKYKPFYSISHRSSWNPSDGQECYWYASRRPSIREDDRGSEVFLHLVDLDFNPRLPAEAVLIPRTTCTNRNLPLKLQQIGELLQFELESAIPLKRIRCLRSPTAPLRPPLQRYAHWRLISSLSLNHLSIADSAEGRDTLQEILRLYDFADPKDGRQLSAVNRQLIDGITAVQSRRVVGRLGGPAAGGFCRGVEVTLEMDEQKYVGTGAFLFASVLERFLALYTSINSFTQLVARIQNEEGVMKKWSPRAGEIHLL